MAVGKGKGKGRRKKKKVVYAVPAPHVDTCTPDRRRKCLDLVRLPLPIQPAHEATPLHDAVRLGDVNTVNFLVGNGCSVSVVDAIGSTPLHYAVAYGRRSMIHFLMSRGADVNAANDYEVTPLHALVVRGELELVRMLADAGANVNTQDYLGMSPLHTAVIEEDMDMVCLLLNRPRYIPKAKDGAEDGDGEEEKEEEKVEEDDDRDPEEIERELRRKKRQEERERKEREEREREREEKERLEAEKWAKPNVIDKAGWAPLHYAAARGYAEIVRVLVQSGANMNIIDARTGECPLHKAILHGRSQVVRYLEGADVNIRSKDNVPLVLVAAQEGFSAIFRWLVEQGGDYRFVDSNGWTLLHHAAANDHLSVVRYLVSDLAVDIHAKNKDGLKPLMLAHDQGIKRFLQRRMLGDLSGGVGEETHALRNTSSTSGIGIDRLSESGGSTAGLLRPESSVAGEAPSVPGGSRPSTGVSGSG